MVNSYCLCVQKGYSKEGMHNILLTAMCQGADSILSVLSESTYARKLRKGGEKKIFLMLCERGSICVRVPATLVVPDSSDGRVPIWTISPSQNCCYIYRIHFPAQHLTHVDPNPILPSLKGLLLVYGLLSIRKGPCMQLGIGMFLVECWPNREKTIYVCVIHINSRDRHNNNPRH